MRPAEILSFLEELKVRQAEQLLALVSPHMTPSSQVPSERSWMFRDATGYSDPQSIAQSFLPPIYGVTLHGVIYNGYGSRALRTWQQMSLEDIVRLQQLIEQRLTAQPQVQAEA